MKKFIRKVHFSVIFTHKLTDRHKKYCPKPFFEAVSFVRFLNQTAGTTLIALSFALFLGSGSVSNVTF